MAATKKVDGSKVAHKCVEVPTYVEQIPSFDYPNVALFIAKKGGYTNQLAGVFARVTHQTGDISVYTVTMRQSRDLEYMGQTERMAYARALGITRKEMESAYRRVKKIRAAEAMERNISDLRRSAVKLGYVLIRKAKPTK